MVMQIPNGISIEVGGVDADYVLYQVTVADGMFAGTAELYDEALPADLAMLIEGFPLSHSDHRNREFGSRSERIAGGWLEVTCVCTDRPGHVVLQAAILNEARSADVSVREATVHIDVEPAELDRFARALRTLPRVVGASVELRGAV